MNRVLVCLVLFGLLAVVAALRADHVHLEKGIALRSAPEGWADLGPAPPTASIELILALRSSREASVLDERLMAVASPSSPTYGKYWTRTQVNAFLAPSFDDFRTAMNWLIENELNQHQVVGGRFVEVHTTVAAAEALLDVSFRHVRHSAFGTELYRSFEDYTIPQQVSDAVIMIAGVNRFPKTPRALGQAQSQGGDQTTPESIQAMYNITVPPTSAGNLQAVASFLGQYYSPEDLATFEARFGLPNVPIARTLGANNPGQRPGVEASLDVQYLLGVGNCSVETWVFSTPGETPSRNEPFFKWLVGLNNLTTIPYLISISYQDYEETVSEKYAQVVNQEFMAYALQGITFITGSGDWGVGCPKGSCSQFSADFPSSSPYVISTGATTYSPAGPEVGVAFSSGGFSNYFARPSFQDAAVSAYLAQPGLPPSSMFNSSGRGFPDISTIGTDFVVYVSNEPNSVGGTSASTPTFGSMLSMINSLRLASNKPVLGYALPFIYQAWSQSSTSFMDITGSQPQDNGCCSGRFAAASGWDPMTGLGVPNYRELSSLAMSASVFPSFA